MLKILTKTLLTTILLLLPILISGFVVTPSAKALSPSDAIGTINIPPGSDRWQAKAQAEGYNIGLIYFVSNMITLFTVVMGVWVIFNIILAGFVLFQASGDAGAFEKVRNQVTQSVIGLMLIVIAYTATGVIGLIFFGDAGIFLNPQI